MNQFEAARAIGTNLSGVGQEIRDTRAIDSILSQMSKEKNPEVIQDSIGKILSQVSPERQGQAIQFLQNRYAEIKNQEGRQKQKESLRSEGINPDLPQNIQLEQYKNRQKNQRLAQFGLGGQQYPKIPTIDQVNIQSETLIPKNKDRSFMNLSDDQLVIATGAPDKEISEPAKAELNRRQEKIKLQTNISQEILKENEKESKNLVQSESALNLMKDAISSRDLSFFSPDNLAEITGIEGFRSKEGALFKTAGKEFFIGTLQSSGARPNQFIEKQIVDMLPRIGRSTAANLSVARAFENEIDLKKEKVRLTRQLADDLEKDLGYVPRNIGQIRDQKLKEYAEKKQKELNNDLKAYKSIEEKTKENFMKVDEGTPISKVVAKALLVKYNNNTNKAREEAEKLGYVF